MWDSIQIRRIHIFPDFNTKNLVLSTYHVCIWSIAGGERERWGGGREKTLIRSRQRFRLKLRSIGFLILSTIYSPCDCSLHSFQYRYCTWDTGGREEKREHTLDCPMCFNNQEFGLWQLFIFLSCARILRPACVVNPFPLSLLGRYYISVLFFLGT